MNTPQYILILILLLRVFAALALHGENVNFKVSVIRSAVYNSILIALLYWGGFFG